MKKKIMYIDMDGTVADIVAGYDKLDKKIRDKYPINEACDIEELRLYKDLPPMKNAINVVNKLSEKYDVYFLTTVPSKNPLAYVDKANWIKKYFPNLAKKMITSKYKNLNCGDYLIDDRTKNGAKDFKGEFIQFGNDLFKSWNIIEEKLLHHFK